MSDPDTSVNILAGGAELLDRVGPLWVQLGQHHAAMSPRWRADLQAVQFDDRRERLLRKSTGGMLVLLAVTDHVDVGYCICTLDAEREAEVDSLFVIESCRRRGLGGMMIQRAMQWFADRPTRRITLSVMTDNSDAVRLYERHGFAPRTITMQHTNTK